MSFNRAEERIDKQELTFLATGGEFLKNTIPNPAPDWLFNKNWDEICRLDCLVAYNGIFLMFIHDYILLKIFKCYKPI